MRLHEAGGDLQLGLDEAAVEPHHRAAFGRPPEEDVIGFRGGVVVLHPHGVEHPGIADQLRDLSLVVRPMESGGDEDGDALARHARLKERADHRGQEEAVRHRPRDGT